jgi:hypothetical protein
MYNSHYDGKHSYHGVTEDPILLHQRADKSGVRLGHVLAIFIFVQGRISKCRDG